MSEKIYNKLVRDKIPEIIKASGNNCETEIVDKDKLIYSLNIKLVEEVNEYLESGELEEIADVLEVIYALLDNKEVTKEEIESIRKKKSEERGGFSKGIKLTKVY